MQYPPLTQFGQTNLAKLHLSPYYYCSPSWRISAWNLVACDSAVKQVVLKKWLCSANFSSSMEFSSLVLVMPVRCQTITWTNADMSIDSLGTNFNEHFNQNMLIHFTKNTGPNVFKGQGCFEVDVHELPELSSLSGDTYCMVLFYFILLFYFYFYFFFSNTVIGLTGLLRPCDKMSYRILNPSASCIQTYMRPEPPPPDSKVHGVNMGPIWVLSAPDGPHVGPMYFAIRAVHCTYGNV